MNLQGPMSQSLLRPVTVTIDILRLEFTEGPVGFSWVFPSLIFSSRIIKTHTL